MATSEGSQQVSSQRAGSAFTTAALAGTFAFKFSGYAVANSRNHYLTGLGQFRIDAAGNLTGTHRSAITPLQGQDAKLRTTTYDLKGTINVDSDGTGTASILFTRTHGGPELKLQGEFYVLLPGSVDRLWMISSGAVILKTGKPADELVNLEAVRIAS